MRAIWCVLLVACGGHGVGPRGPQTDVGLMDEKKVVVANGRVSGTFELTRKPDGSYKVFHEIKDNGRGPRVEGTLSVDRNGFPTRFEATGHYEFGTAIDEHFSRDGHTAQWKSNEEQGTSDKATKAFFIPLAPLPLEPLLAKTALANGGTLTLLPTGEAHVVRAGQMTVTANGQTKKIEGYAIRGLDLTPAYVWFDETGRWFGTISAWNSYVPAGWESVVDTIVAEQNTFERESDKRLYANAVTKQSAQGLAFTHGRVLDVEHGTWLTDHTIVIAGDTITALGPSTTVKPPAGAEVVDLAGSAVLPGLIDMHSHTMRSDGVLDIASGVTTVRDVGNEPEVLDPMKQWFDEGTAVGPRIVRLGFIEGRNEKAAAAKVTAETPVEANAAVDYYAKLGYEGIKIYNSVRPELVSVLAEKAHAKGMFVTGHIPVHMLANEAVRAGYDGIEHINMLFLNFFATHETDTRTTERFTLVGDKATTLDLKSRPVQDFIALLVDKKTVVDPTLIAFDGLYEGEPGAITPGQEAMMARLPPQVQRGSLMDRLPLEKSKRPTYRAAFEKLLEMVKALYDAHVHLVVGTDSIGGLSLHYEMSLYARAGIPNAAVIRMATIDAARAMKLDAKLGSVTVGKVADLLIVTGDPLVDIHALDAVRLVVSRGNRFDSATLYRAVGVAPR